MSHVTYPAEFREAERLEKLKSFALLDTAPEQAFDAVVRLAQRLFDVPIALVSLVDDQRQWFKAKCGVSVSETARSDAFCAHAMLVDDVMVVEDARRDPRFVDNPLVTGEMGIRFYAGVPLRPVAATFSDDLPGIGTLCILDRQPRTPSADDLRALRELADLVTALIQARSATAASQQVSRALRQHTDVLERQQLQLRQAERMAGVGSWRYDLVDEVLHWSDQVYDICGMPPGSAPSVEDGLRFYPDERRGQIRRLLDRASRYGEAFDFESDFTTADGRQRRVRSMAEVQMTEGRPVAVIGLFQDITDRYLREQSLRRTADTDALTGLANRAACERRLAEVVARATAEGSPACLLLLDLDGFKGVNDTFGHAAGDDVLRTVADRLRQLAPPMSFVARLGGDEFVMLLTRPRDCAQVEARIVEILNSLRHNVERDGECRAVSATIGAAFVDASVASAAEATHRADVALYEAKRSRRGTGRIHGLDIVITPSVAPAPVLG